MNVNLILHIDEVRWLLDLMGQQPTSSNVWPLANKVRMMAETQLPKPDGVEDAVTAD
jgi:hypothetical protein